MDAFTHAAVSDPNSNSTFVVLPDVQNKWQQYAYALAAQAYRQVRAACL